MKKRNLILAGIAAGMILTASVPSALAYFTTYVSAKGMKDVVLQDRTELEEPEPENWTKVITIKADADSEPVYVRANAFAPDDYTLTFSGTGWSQGEGGWYYFSTPISKGGAAEALNVKIDKNGGFGKEDIGENFNVVVVYEYTPVLYREDTLEPYADWSKSVEYHETVNSEVTEAETGGENG